MPRLPSHTPWFVAVLFFLLGAVAMFGVSKGLRLFPQFEERILRAVSNVAPETVLAAVNAERQAQGLGFLQEDDSLTQAAQARANDIAEREYWSHTAPTGEQAWDFIHEAGYTYRLAGENLARDFVDVEELTSAWLASPTHRANVLNGQFQEAGIAVASGSFGEKNTTVVVMLFAQPTTAGALETENSETSRISTPFLVSQDNTLQRLEFLFSAGIVGSIVALAFAHRIQKR